MTVVLGAADEPSPPTVQSPKSPLRWAKPSDVPKTLPASDAKQAIDLSVEWLISNQREIGCWGSEALDTPVELGYSVETYYAWQSAAHAIAILALQKCDETPSRKKALDLAIKWLVESREPRRGSNWDTDYLWAALYGAVACVSLAEDPRYQGNETIAKRGRAYMEVLQKNQTPCGGWAYYDNPTYSQRPKWGTSFCTALILPALIRAQVLGWLSDPKVVQRAIDYVERCQLPEGAYSYDWNPVPRISGGEHINRLKGSLSRIQVCNWALTLGSSSKVGATRVRQGLKDFMQQHKFLDVARLRPLPHEAYYANAGYFYFFGHYYAAQVANTLPANEREIWHAQLRPHIIKTLKKDGSTSDFLHSTYMLVASTSYAILTLQAGLPLEGPAEKQ